MRRTANTKSMRIAPKILSSADEEFIKEIRAKIDKCTKDTISTSSYSEQSNAMSKIIKSNMASVEDLFIQNSSNLFLLHRELAAKCDEAIAVRITVQYNLFGGCVANLGDAKQCTWLKGVFERGELGCFALTERGAGVLSGLIVETECKWTTDGFVLNSPSTAAYKVWISQGLTAKWMVVIARLILKDGTDKGPHAFIVDTESDGVIKADMVQKTDFNGLDNANIHFEDVVLHPIACFQKYHSLMRMAATI